MDGFDPCSEEVLFLNFSPKLRPQVSKLLKFDSEDLVAPVGEESLQGGLAVPPENPLPCDFLLASEQVLLPHAVPDFVKRILQSEFGDAPLKSAGHLPVASVVVPPLFSDKAFFAAEVKLLSLPRGAAHQLSELDICLGCCFPQQLCFRRKGATWVGRGSSAWPRRQKHCALYVSELLYFEARI